MNFNNRIFKLKGCVQNYAWGGKTFLPSLLNFNNTDEKPCAEYWMGAHTSAPSTLHSNGNTILLSQLLQDNLVDAIGEKTATQFGELPYLFKVLDVHDMLSIQVHPTKLEAEKGFLHEEQKGIAINASNRNYKDKNHKPEVMIAMGDFWLLHGFKMPVEIEKTLQQVPELNKFLPLYKAEGLKSLYAFFMQMNAEDVDATLYTLVKKEISKMNDGLLTKNDAGWWVAKLYNQNTELKNLDKGIFSIYLFNIVTLKHGEAIFQAAGVPHAYLEGQNIELMANSDNVLRGGLTPKHIDVDELIKHTLFEGIVPNILQENTLGNENFYNCPVPDFGISKIGLKQGQQFQATTTSFEIFFITQGGVIIKNMENEVFKKGDAIAILHNTNYSFTAIGATEIYKAYVP